MAKEKQWARAGMMLAAWRQRRTQSITVSASALGSTTPIWCSWEHGRKRPCLAMAMALEVYTGGELKIEDWGYPSSIVDSIRTIALRRSGASLSLESVA